jgi:hypothetical protein
VAIAGVAVGGAGVELTVFCVEDDLLVTCIFKVIWPPEKTDEGAAVITASNDLLVHVGDGMVPTCVKPLGRLMLTEASVSVVRSATATAGIAITLKVKLPPIGNCTPPVGALPQSAVTGSMK